MIDTNFISFSILILTSCLLFYVAANDLRELKISNELVIVLAVLFFAHAFASGRWMQMHWNIGFAVASFFFMLYWYGQGLMGGGDLKLLSVALLWTGVGCALPFLIIMLSAALLHALLGRLGWITTHRDAKKRMKVAFAPSIAAGLIGIFMLGCLRPAPANLVSGPPSQNMQVPLR